MRSCVTHRISLGWVGGSGWLVRNFFLKGGLQRLYVQWFLTPPFCVQCGCLGYASMSGGFLPMLGPVVFWPTLLRAVLLAYASVSSGFGPPVSLIRSRTLVFAPSLAACSIASFSSVPRSEMTCPTPFSAHHMINR